MRRFPNLTLKRILRRHKENPQDKKIHKAIEESSISKKSFLGFVTKAALDEKESKE